MVYHVGIGKRGQTMVIQASTNVDSLSCEIYDYMGKRVTTKKDLRKNRYGLLKLMQDKKPGVYGKLQFAVVE
jgi:hypothetical protein